MKTKIEKYDRCKVYAREGIVTFSRDHKTSFLLYRVRSLKIIRGKVWNRILFSVWENQMIFAEVKVKEVWIID